MLFFLTSSGEPLIKVFPPAMTIISSGGFLPTNSLEILLNTKTKEIVLSFLMLLSFFSLFLSYNIFTIKNKNLSFFQEDFYLFIYFCFLVVLLFLLTNLSHERPL